MQWIKASMIRRKLNNALDACDQKVGFPKIPIKLSVEKTDASVYDAVTGRGFYLT